MHADTDNNRQPWSPERAQQWAAANPWVCGFNFLPSSAVNFIELWQAQHFDSTVIRRELGWAQQLGFNALRVNLSYTVWQTEGAGYLQRIAKFLELAATCHLRVVLCLFDDCAFSGLPSVYQTQPDPQPGVHNSRAVGSPGREIVLAGNQQAQLEVYVKTIISQFADDQRVLFWDLYNEPGNRMIFRDGHYTLADENLLTGSLRLMQDSFHWAREVNPRQPLTVAAWDVPYPFTGGQFAYRTTIDQQAIALSDIVSFHAYCTAEQMQALLARLRQYAQGRPLMCTEWMARHIGSCINDQLPLLKAENVGAFNWGLVQGRTQTHYPWPFLQQSGQVVDEKLWFHDLLNQQGTAFDRTEIKILRQLTSL